MIGIGTPPYRENLSPGYINTHISCCLSLGIAEGYTESSGNPTSPAAAFRACRLSQLPGTPIPHNKNFPCERRSLLRISGECVVTNVGHSRIFRCLTDAMTVGLMTGPNVGDETLPVVYRTRFY